MKQWVYTVFSETPDGTMRDKTTIALENDCVTRAENQPLDDETDRVQRVERLSGLCEIFVD